MRTHGFRTHVLMVIAGAIGMIVSLGRPWYAKAPAPSSADSALYDLSDAMLRWFNEPGGTLGRDALGSWGEVLVVLSVAGAVLALVSTVAALQGAVREPLRYGSFAVFAIALWKVVDTPGPNEALELRLGAFVGLVSATVLWVSAQGVANAPMRRAVERPRYTPPPPPPAYEPGR